MNRDPKKSFLGWPAGPAAPLCPGAELRCAEHGGIGNDRALGGLQRVLLQPCPLGEAGGCRPSSAPVFPAPAARRPSELGSEAAREMTLLEVQACGEEPAPDMSGAAEIMPEG